MRFALVYGIDGFKTAADARQSAKELGFPDAVILKCWKPLKGITEFGWCSSRDHANKLMNQNRDYVKEIKHETA